MADDEEAILKAKLDAAADYEERSLIRRQLRELKKKKSEGQPSSTAKRGSSAYRRFSGVAVDNKSTTSASKASVLPVKVFGKLEPHRETTRTPSPSGSESSQKAALRTPRTVSPTSAPYDVPAIARKASYPLSTGSEGEKEEVAAVNGSSPAPSVEEEVQSRTSTAVEGRKRDEEARVDVEVKEKEDVELGEETGERLEEVEEEREKASPPEEKVVEEEEKDLQPEEKIGEERLKDLQPEEKVEEEPVKESQPEEELDAKPEIVEEQVEELLPGEKVKEERVKETQAEEKVEEERAKETQAEEKVEKERVKETQAEEKVEEKRVKDVQLEEDSNATVKEETDFHFRRRAKTEVKPKSSPASSAAAEFQGFKLRKTGAAKETKEAKSQPGTKAPEFLGFQLRKTGSTAQKTQGVVESKSQPTAKSSKLQDSRRREANSSIQKAGEMKEKESQPTPKASGFQSFQGKTSESSARKSRETEHTATKSPEFQGFQLRKTDASTARSRAQTWGVSSKPAMRKAPLSLPKLSDARELTVAELDSCLDQFVSRIFKSPTNGQPLNTFCKNPRVLCNWINLAVPGTVDLRALTVAKDKRAEEYAREENMTLAVESARAIGCRVTDDTEKRLLNGDNTVSRQLVLDLVKAKAVNLPGMRDAPEGTFQNPSLLFAVFEIGPVATFEATDASQTASRPLQTTATKTATFSESDKGSGTERDAGIPSKHATTSKQPITTSKEPEPTSKEPSKSAASDREASSTLKDADNSGTGDLSYEERAALRRAAREKRKQERAALAAKS